MLDLTDPRQPRYAEHRADHRQNVGSVGKLLVALALFQALADAYPNDVETRRRVLKDTRVTADGFSQSDHHTVRFFDPKSRTLERRPVRVGDVGSLYEWLDWMLSPSSNSAAGMVMREAMLLRQFGAVYPPGEAEIKRLIYVTENRIRYASSPALANAAVYFMSGSLFACAQEAGFTCKPYAGNVKN